MNLSLYEKRSLFRFMGVYIGAVIIIISGFSTLFYKIEKNAFQDKTFNSLRIKAFKIASNAIDAQMQNKNFIIPKDTNYMLLDKNKKIIKSNFKENIYFNKEFYIKNGCAYHINKGAKGHQGIFYIVTKECNYQKYLNSIRYHTLLIAFAALIFLMIVGWYLGRLFLKPMREKIKELDLFIKDSTHELNTPITTMLLALQKIEKKGALEKYLKSLKMSANLISSIYQDITFITLRKNRKAKIGEIDIAKQIRKSLDFFEILIEQKRLKVITNLSYCKVNADIKDIEILIKNLIDNGVKYSKINGVLKIELKNYSFCITNEGKTIDKDKLKDIFQRYKRFDKTNGGFGIGLDIAKTICKKYNFKISVSSYDKKTTFRIDF